MQRFSLGSLLSRRWMLLVAVLVIAVAGFAVYRLNPKHVVMEVFGAAGTVATITYLDIYCLDKSG